MANLASSQVSILSSWTEGGVTGKRRIGMRVYIETSDDGTGQGDATDKIIPSAFGMQKFESCSAFYYADQTKIVPAVVNHDGSAILLCDVNVAADGDRGLPKAMAAADLYGEIHGY